MKLHPIAKAILLRLRRQADDFAQQPVAKMTKAETMAFLANAPVRVLDITPEFAARLEQATHDIDSGHTVRLTGMSDEELADHWQRTLPLSHISRKDLMRLLANAANAVNDMQNGNLVKISGMTREEQRKALFGDDDGDKR